MKEEFRICQFKNGEKFFISKREEKLLNDMVSLRSYYIEEYTKMEMKIIEFKERLITRYNTESHLLEKAK